MKTINKLTIIVLIGLITFGCSVQASEFSLNIKQIAESKIKVKISNDTDSSIIVPLKFIPEDYYIRFEIIDPKGKKVSFIGKEIKFYPCHSDYVRMDSQSSFEQTIELREYYALAKDLYKIRAIYQVDKFSRNEEGLWYGAVDSNWIELDLR